eukprot:scaffold384245_cov45-Prasinocladus_malaysianus.AAC.1
MDGIFGGLPLVYVVLPVDHEDARVRGVPQDRRIHLVWHFLWVSNNQSEFGSQRLLLAPCAVIELIAPF